MPHPCLRGYLPVFILSPKSRRWLSSCLPVYLFLYYLHPSIAPFFSQTIFILSTCPPVSLSLQYYIYHPSSRRWLSICQPVYLSLQLLQYHLTLLLADDCHPVYLSICLYSICTSISPSFSQMIVILSIYLSVSTASAAAVPSHHSSRRLPSCDSCRSRRPTCGPRRGGSVRSPAPTSCSAPRPPSSRS